MSSSYQPAKIKHRAFIKPRWRKVLRDLWHNKTRTLVVVLSIAVGVFAMGTIVGTQVMLSTDLEEAYLATDPASAVLFPDRFQQELVDVVENMDGVEAAEGRRNTELQIITGPESQTLFEVDVFDDYENIQLNRIKPEQGAWPPPKHEVLIERSYLANIDAEVGDTLLVETPDGKQREMRIAGLVHDLNLPPAEFVSEVRGYVTFETLEWLGMERGFDEMHILVSENKLDEEHIRAVADRVEDKIENTGRTNYWTWIPEPGKHPATDAVEPLLVILGVLGGLSLFLSGFLVVNTISALLGQQVRQIGIMKSIGARSSQIASMYLISVVIFGLLSLFIAVPLGGYVAYAFTEYMAGLINFDLAGFRIPPQVLLLEVAVGIIVPVLAAAVPVIIGSRISAAEAMSDVGLGRGNFGTSILDRGLQALTATIRAISRPMRISLRNTIRRKARLALTLFTLTLGGAIFIAVLTVHASLLTTLDDALSYWNYHVEVDFSSAHRIAQIEREAMKIPGVVQAESWIGNTGRRIRPDGEEGPNFGITGAPANTTLIQPTILEGRWLLSSDENAIVVNTTLLEEEPDIKIGDDISVKIEGRETDWHVVGIARGVMTGQRAYVNYPYFAKVVRFMGRSGGVQLVAEDANPATQEALARRAKAYFEDLGMRISGTETTASIRENIEFQFNIIVSFLAFMAVLIALVGGLGLMGTMSMNVMERTREIGVMRAVGADNSAILKVILVEGLFIGFISWVIGVLAALPISRLMSHSVGIAFIDAPLSYTFSTQGALIWLGLVLLLSGLASFLPSWNASRLTIREVLAYE